MKIQPLYDLQREVNRLFIAGARFAPGDPRLGKLAPVFEKLGEKAPVFGKVAAAIMETVGADSRQAAEKLKALSVMLYSILYTQGEAAEEPDENRGGRQEQQPVYELDAVNTGRSYSQLRVLRELASAKSGRLELLQDAFEQGVFRDFRTFRYLDAALGDKYSELADYVESTVIPQAGPGMLPFLLGSFAYEDKSEQIRRFRALAAFNPPELKSVTAKIFQEPLPGQLAVAVGVVADDPQNEDFIIKLAGDKNKKVREAAFEALGRLGTEQSLQALLAAFQKAKSDTALEAVAPSLAAVCSKQAGARTPQAFRAFFDPIFERVGQSFAELLQLDKKSDPKEATARTQRFITHLGILKNKELPEVVDFLAMVLTGKEFNAIMAEHGKAMGRTGLRGIFSFFPNYGYTVDWGVHIAMAGILDSFGPETSMPFYETQLAENFKKQPSPLWDAWFKKARQTYPTEKLYAAFAPAFKNKVISTDCLFAALNAEMEYDGEFYRRAGEAGPGAANRPPLDPRWLEPVYEHFGGKNIVKHSALVALRILHAFEPKDSARFNRFLIELSPGEHHFAAALERLAMILDRELPDRFELVYAHIAKFPKRDYHHYLSSRKLWSLFPAEYAEKFRKLHESCGHDYLLRIVDEIPLADDSAQADEASEAEPHSA